MTTALWLSLFVLIAAPLACGGYATTRGLRTFRSVRRLGRGIERTIAPVLATAAEAETRAASIEAGQIRLQQALARLQASRAELDVLRRAYSESRDSLNKLTSLFPRK
jgi:hypothetical protein